MGLITWLVIGFLSGCLTVAILHKASNDLTPVLAIAIVAIMTVQGIFSTIFSIPFLIGFLIHFKGERL